MPRRHAVPVRPAQLHALRGDRRPEQAARRRPGHPGPAGRVQPPDRGAGRRGHLPGVRRQPDQPRLRGLRGEARRPRRPRRARDGPARRCTACPDRMCAGAPLATLHACRRCFAASPTDARRGPATEAELRRRPRRRRSAPKGYTPSKRELGKTTPKRPQPRRRVAEPPPANRARSRQGGCGSGGARAARRGAARACAAATSSTCSPATGARSGRWCATSSTPGAPSAPGSSAARWSC